MKHLISILFILCFSNSIQAQKISKKELRYKPTNLTDAVAHLKNIHDDTTRKKIMEMSESEFSSNSHFGMGLWMRNNWGLWRGGKLAKHFYSLGIFHPDDMSGIILTTYHRELNNKDWTLDEQIKRYQDYWEATSKHFERLEKDPEYKKQIERSQDSTQTAFFLKEKDKMKPGLKVTAYVDYQCGFFSAGNRSKIEGTIIDWADDKMTIKIDKYFEPNRIKKINRCNKVVDDIIKIVYNKRNYNYALELKEEEKSD